MSESQGESKPEATTTLGQVLRSAREASGIDLPKLAEKTRLPLKILTALESDDLENLPAPPYVRAFVITLAREFNLKADGLMDLYRNQLPKHPEPPPPSEVDSLNPRPTSKLRNFVLSLLFLVILLAGLMYLKNTKQGPAPPQNDGEETATETEWTPPPSPLPDSLNVIEVEDSLLGAGPSKQMGDKEKSPLPETTKQDSSPSRTARNSPPAKPGEHREVPPSARTVAKFICIVDSVWVHVKRGSESEVNTKLVRDQTWVVTHDDTLYVSSGVLSGLDVLVNGNYYRPTTQKFALVRGKLLE